MSTGQSLPVGSSAAKRSSGIFITIEGGEGVGKTTHVRILSDRLQAAGIAVLSLREPGGTAISEQIRAILLDSSNSTMAQHTELLLYEAARAQLVSERILPALAEGTVVLCDRYLDSTVAYQGFGRRLGQSLVDQANRLGSLDLLPDRTVLLIDDTKTALTRARVLGGDRIEAEDLSFHQRVAEGFMAVARNQADRVRVVNVQTDWLDTAELVLDAVIDLFSNRNRIDFAIPAHTREWVTDLLNNDV
jgi:dTMP kinase